MTIDEIVDYVMHTLHNTNRAILTNMLTLLVEEAGGGGGGDTPGGDDAIIYDGGVES